MKISAWNFKIFLGIAISVVSIDAAAIQKRSAELFPLAIIHINDFHSK